MPFIDRAKPLFAPAFRRILGPGLPETSTLQPAEIEIVRPPALLPGMLDRVIATDEHSDLAYHLAAARETTVSHAPVLRRDYRNALVNRDGFATWRYRERYPQAQDLGALTGPLLKVKELRYCHNYVIWRYFGHWLTDAIPTALIAPDDGALWMPPNPDWAHAADYIRVLGLPVVAAPLVLAERLTVYLDYGQGSHKQARYAVIRDRLQARFGNTHATDCVYIRRGRTGALRWIANEAALLDALVARNWQVLDIASMAMEDLQRALCKARVVVSIDGSHIDHAHLSLQPGSAMVILLPQDRFSTRQVGLCRAHGVSPGLVVLTGTQNQGYHADLSEVLRTVDLAEAAARA
jgi:hypothetical protein